MDQLMSRLEKVEPYENIGREAQSLQVTLHEWQNAGNRMRQLFGFSRVQRAKEVTQRRCDTDRPGVGAADFVQYGREETVAWCLYGRHSIPSTAEAGMSKSMRSFRTSPGCHCT